MKFFAGLLHLVPLLMAGIASAEWDLVWSDEFDGSGELDQTK